MRNAEYWKIRFLELEEASNKYGLETYMQIEPAFDSAQRKIQKEIEAWYGRYARNNGITMQEARKILSAKELKEFRWDVEEYIKHGRQSTLNPQWIKELENASARVHISRLEALKLRTQQAVEVAFGNELDCIDAMARKIYTEDYYHSIFEMQKGFGIGWEIGQIDQKKLDKFIKKPWAADGKHFSDRIWQQKGQLVNEIHQQLTRTCIMGKAPDDAIKAISKKFDTSRSNAGRLVMTEQAYFHSVAQQEAFSDLDVEEFEIVATLDSITSEICQEMDGKHFPMSTYEAGVTAPPFHPWCRSVTVPYFEDNFTGERAARNADGETYYVPDNMTYKEWKKGMVDGDTGGLEPVEPEKPEDAVADVAEDVVEVEKLDVANFPAAFSSKSEKKNTEIFVDYVNSIEGANADTIRLYNSMGELENVEANGIPFKISHGKNHAVETTMRYNGDLVDASLTIPKLSGDNLAGQVNTALHEEMHLIDFYCRTDPKKAGGWFSSGRQSLADAVKNASPGMSDEVATLFRDFKSEYDRTYDAIRAEYKKKMEALRLSYYPDGRVSPFANISKYQQYQKEAKKIDRWLDDEMDYQCRNIMGGGVNALQDIYDALSGGVFRDNGTVIYGHGSKYYRGTDSRVHEIFANYGALSVARPDLLEMLRRDKPELVAELEAAVKEILRKVGK